MTKVLVATIAALFTVTAPAFAQQENAIRCPGGVCRPVPPGPHPPDSSRPPPIPPGPRSPPIYSDPQFDNSQSQQQPRLCVELGAGVAGELQFEWRHDAAGRRICQVFGIPGSYCECTNRFKEGFTGIVR